MAAPMALPAGALKPSMDVKLGGADSGTVKVSGPANAEPIPDKAPVSLSDMTGTYKPGKSGKVTLSPDQLTIDVTMAPGSTPINVPCKAASSGVSLELDTAAQPGAPVPRRPPPAAPPRAVSPRPARRTRAASRPSPWSPAR